MARHKPATRYRDAKTGRFVAQATYARSRARGGTRYVRARVAPAPKPATRPSKTPKPKRPSTRRPPAKRAPKTPRKPPQKKRAPAPKPKPRPASAVEFLVAFTYESKKNRSNTRKYDVLVTARDEEHARELVNKSKKHRWLKGVKWNAVDVIRTDEQATNPVGTVEER
jgi:hypothetical protein